jgi:hypothetical protein
MRPGTEHSVVLLCALAFGCTSAGDSREAAPTGASTGGVSAQGSCEPVGDATLTNRDQEIMQRLSPTCIGCHNTGDNRPLFASEAAFANLLVYNLRYVKPGDPEHSELVHLLEGQGTLSFRQMPVGGDAFAARAERGETQIGMAELRTWIAGLVAPAIRGVFVAQDGPTVRRLTTEQLLQNLAEQLGLTDADFFDATYDTLVGAGAAGYPVRSPDAIGGTRVPYREPYLAYRRFETLGGPNWLEGKQRHNDLSPSFLQTYVPLSQAWCRIAVEKKTSALFREASLADTSARAADRIRKNIAYLHLRMLGEPAPEATVTEILERVFVAYEAQSTSVAWTAVCSTLARHPLWLAY